MIPQPGLESEATNNSVSRAEQIQLSTAISLKRIADALAGTEDGQNSGILHAMFDLANQVLK